MTERRYSLKEIDDMRAALHFMAFRSIKTCSGAFEERVEKQVERHLRTYLAAGVDPEEIKEKARKFRDGMRRIVNSPTPAVGEEAENA